jgi:hypothetical protein
LTALLSLGLASVARAEVTVAKTEQFELTWQAPPSCPVATEVAAAVARLLSEGATSSKRALLVHGSVTSTSRGAGLLLEMRAGEQRSRRELSANTCAELGDAAALVIALAINPELASEPQAPDAAPGVPECPAQSPPVCPEPPVCEAPLPPRCPLRSPVSEAPKAPAPIATPSGFRGGLGVDLTLGALPQALPSPRVSAAYVGSRARLDLSASLAWAMRASGDGAAAAGFQLWKLSPRGWAAQALALVAKVAAAGRVAVPGRLLVARRAAAAVRALAPAQALPMPAPAAPQAGPHPQVLAPTTRAAAVALRVPIRGKAYSWSLRRSAWHSSLGAAETDRAR